MLNLKKIEDDELKYYQSLYEQEYGDNQERNIYLSLLDHIETRHVLSQQQIDKIRNELSEKDYDAVYESTCKLIRQLEKITVDARSLPLGLGFNPAKKKTFGNLDAANMFFEEENHILHITMESLLPSRDIGSTNLEYLRDTYYNAFYERFKDGKFKVYENKVVIVFVQIYANNAPMRDNDNSETKVITDLISTFSLIDDNPYWCNQYFLSEKGEYTHTEIFVVPESQFVEFLINRQNKKSP
ncbi:MAG: hypothetical protein IKB01_01815 [Lachnospiraceae bacterium]|nr:hypothetical protein [Lachnospiraceae bacterium]